MKQLTIQQRCQVVAALVEGNSIRAVVRMTGVAKNTVTKLLVDLGCVCTEYQDKTLRNLDCKRLELDEIWSFVGMKDRQVPAERKGEYGIGDVWTWVAIDPVTKLVPSWLVGNRDGECARMFVDDLASRLTGRVQITTDGLKAYIDAVGNAFPDRGVDYAMLIKHYGPSDSEGNRRYSPAECLGCERHVMVGAPDPKYVSTSIVERQNLTMRMSMRRFTRLTNGFSKKVENHTHAIALHFMHYNFCRMHQSLRMTPAMKAGVTDRKWGIEDIVALLPELKYNSRPKKKAS